MSTNRLSLCREISYDAFVKIIKRQLRPEEVLDLSFKQRNLSISRVDKNFITEVLYGSLRWYSKLYWILQKTSKRDLAKLSSEVNAALILGTYQIFYMDKVPDRAAVNESVEYIRYKGQATAVPFVNGILRAIARRSEYFAKPNKDKQPTDYLSLQYAHPKWMIERWSNRFNFSRLKVILSANNQKPPYAIRVNSLTTKLSQISSLRKTLLKKEKNHSDAGHSASCLYLKNYPLMEKNSLFSNGFFSIQDEASQIISFLVDPRQQTVIYDACAGPGGKTAHLYEITQGQSKIYAFEKSLTQIKKAKENFKRLGHEHINLIHQDFLDVSTEHKADKILLDAPCSGLGTIRRHPEAKILKTPTSIANLIKLQRKLITHALSLLKPDGELIYSVCSFETEETIDQLEWVQEKFSTQISVVSPKKRLSEYYKKFITRNNLLLTYPSNTHQMDGFGAFILKKN